jgi:hypothetical protein
VYESLGFHGRISSLVSHPCLSRFILSTKGSRWVHYVDNTCGRLDALASKIFSRRHGYKSTLKTVDESLVNFGLGILRTLVIHEITLKGSACS